MTREEQIAEAYQDYLGLGGVLHPNPWFAFKAGAEWADENPNFENVWHPTTELPRNEFIALLSDGEAVCGRLIHDASGDNDHAVFIYEDYVIDWSIVVKWAYIKDILPKGGEK